jgi:hypothetical protein
MADKGEEVVYLNNCELFVESLQLRKRGTYYLVWKKGKKNVQSSTYSLNGEDPVFPKELLSLSLKVYYQSGLPLPRHVPPPALRPTSSSSTNRGKRSIGPN